MRGLRSGGADVLTKEFDSIRPMAESLLHPPPDISNINDEDARHVLGKLQDWLGCYEHFRMFNRSLRKRRVEAESLLERYEDNLRDAHPSPRAKEDLELAAEYM